MPDILDEIDLLEKKEAPVFEDIIKKPRRPRPEKEDDLKKLLETIEEIESFYNSD